MFSLLGRPRYLLGFATDHPRLPGYRRYVRTSRVMRFDEAGCEAETVNTVYRLQLPIEDLMFHEDQTIAQIKVAGFVADRVEGSPHWVVLRDQHPVAEFFAPEPSQIIFQLLQLASR